MEAIGRLAGGIAHDFNNLLTVINGYTELLQSEDALDEPTQHSLEEIARAANRASELTARLLTFSRKGVMKPKVANLNTVVADMARMLRRVIGENLELSLALSDDIWNVRVDANQIEQILLNMALNSRDAMPDGGVLTVETVNKAVDEEFAARHAELVPGRYVMIAVSDTGCGMEAEIARRVFEPFFSTKGEQGTGLGLATVYGIVRQHNGYVWCYSEPERGTTFKVYLPAVFDPVDDGPPQPSERTQPGEETILVVEDEESILEMACLILSDQGYCVLQAPTGEDALQVEREYTEKIDLLLTDVVLPDINGRELSDRFSVLRPDMKVIFTSGYTDNIIARHGILEDGIEFLQKPYRVDELFQKVRSVLDREDAISKPLA